MIPCSVVEVYHHSGGMYCPHHRGQRVNQAGKMKIVYSSKMLITIYRTTQHHIATPLITQDLTTGLSWCADKIFMFYVSEPGHSWMTWAETQTKRTVATKHHCMQHASWVSRSLSLLRSDAQHAWRFCCSGGEFPLTVGDENVLIFRLRTRYVPKIEGDIVFGDLFMLLCLYYALSFINFLALYFNAMYFMSHISQVLFWLLHEIWYLWSSVLLSLNHMCLWFILRPCQ